jgi:phenylalanine-4-hydroxylase
MSSDSAVPPHLRRYVVQQDYAAYTARDQAVWRFVVSQAHTRLVQSAHPAYAPGFAAAGISTERIPNLREMSARLSEHGFRVVCVDGFIPPRAFQAFQARGMLPVAADIRSAEHLTYTPAPDIIHEAAGHAPFLADAAYARFLRRIGAVSEQAFDNGHDRAMYRAIYTLSELKESPESTPAQLAQAEAELTWLRAQPAPISEATRMARLYWWTVEYGLVGTLDDYRLYGAGLLSSIGEAHFCHDPRVEKLPLSSACLDVDYDITQAQPQLFVARDFEQLESVLSEAEQTLSHVRGGDAALSAAQASNDLATFTLDTGLSLVGTLQSFDAGLLQLSGPCLVAEALRPVAALPERCRSYVLPLGATHDGTPLSALSEAALRRHMHNERLLLRTQAGLLVQGVVDRCHVQDGRVRALSVRELRITRGDALLLEARATYPLLLAERVRSASPLLPDGYHAATEYPLITVPKARHMSARERVLLELHEQLSRLRPSSNAAALASLEAMHEALHAYPEEWLLRINTLEAVLAHGGRDTALAGALSRELTQLEQHFGGREPIATGLRFTLARGG